ncbi:MAG TPA: aldehyde dehydrogenase family protein [Solirubrobacteraceae bacterium]|nr:aldehyde dehydrogenase family protein [Solirubrobacteraceae bacterium]
MRTEAFIDGAFVPAAEGATFDDVSPRDGTVIASVAAGTGEDIDRAVRAGRRSFEAGGWALADPAQRKRVLLRLAELIDEHAEELAQLESADVGHPISDARNVDVVNARNCFAWYAEAIDKVYGEIAPTGADALALIGREPLGVVGAVVPWNYPLIISAWKLAPALATGNSVVLKPAEQSPLTALALAELAAEAGVPDGVLNVVPGYGPDAGEPLGRHPDVDKVAFTGSVEIGRRFLVYAGESNGKAVSLELGGKSPQVVLADAGDLDAAAEAIGWGIFYNAGQTCHAGSRVVVARELADPLADRLVEFAREFAPADPAAPDTRLGAMISEEHLDGVLARVTRAASDGAEVLVGGERAAPVPGGAYMLPTVIEALDPADPIVQEEVFGPVLAIQRAADVDHAIALANGTGYGLAAAVWSANVTTAHRVARRLRAGTVWVNTFDISSLTTPFGGVRDSGHGRDRSLHALDAYTHLKTTWVAL